MSKTSIIGWPGLLALLTLLLDQLSKWAVILWCPAPGDKTVILLPDLLALVHWRNLGAAWGIFADHTWLLTAISALACLLLIIFFRQFTENRWPVCLASGVLLGGIIGNLIDRAFYPDGVVDFIFVYYKSIWEYPAFNLADSAICCSIIFIMAYFMWHSRNQAKNQENKTNEQ